MGIQRGMSIVFIAALWANLIAGMIDPVPARAENYEVYAFLDAWVGPSPMSWKYGERAAMGEREKEYAKGTPHFFFYIRGQNIEITFGTGFSHGDIAVKEGEWKWLNVSNARECLAKIGADPAQVKIVVLGNLHHTFTHGIDAFPQATFIVQTEDWQFFFGKARRHKYLMIAVHQDHLDQLEALQKRGRVRLVEGDVQIAPGVHLYLASGHTPGNSFLTVETTAGRVILAGETVMTYNPIGRRSSSGICPQSHSLL